jgi:hypothetical protein
MSDNDANYIGLGQFNMGQEMKDPIKAMAESMGLPHPEPGDVNDWGPKLNKILGSPLSPAWKALAAEEYGVLPRIDEPRDRAWEGNIYRIRDVWDDSTVQSRGGFPRLIRCEYATKDASGQTVWKPCQEGCLYSSIEPFGPAPSGSKSSSCNGDFVAFDFTSMAEDLPKAPEPEKRVLHEDIDLQGWRARVSKVMKSPYLPY